MLSSQDLQANAICFNTRITMGAYGAKHNLRILILKWHTFFKEVITAVKIIGLHGTCMLRY